MSFDRDFAWQMKRLPLVKEAILDNLPKIARISEASFEEDTKRNTDLVLKIDATRIAVRLRNARDMHKYGHEFTLRSYRPSGAVTELTKVLAGWGDYNFYGFADDTGLTAWFIGDLSVFRLWHQRTQWRLDREQSPGKEIPNPDGTRFRAYQIDELPPEFVVARQLPPPLAAVS